MTGADAIAIITLLIILVAVGVYLLHWLYRHSSKDEAFVRTGLGGEKVVMGGGAFVIPIIHDMTRVNMNTVPLEHQARGRGLAHHAQQDARGCGQRVFRSRDPDQGERLARRPHVRRAHCRR